jgi:hypothetical protein
VKANELVEKVLSRVRTPVNDKDREAVLRMLQSKLDDFEGPGKDVIRHYVEIFSASWVAKRT